MWRPIDSRKEEDDHCWMKANHCLSAPLDLPMMPSYWLFSMATTSLHISCNNIAWCIVWLEKTCLHHCFQRIIPKLLNLFLVFFLMNTFTSICICICMHSWGRPYKCEYVNLCHDYPSATNKQQCNTLELQHLDLRGDYQMYICMVTCVLRFSQPIFCMPFSLWPKETTLGY